MGIETGGVGYGHPRTTQTMNPFSGDKQDETQQIYQTASKAMSIELTFFSPAARP